jgi:hypothetical protein
MFQRLYRWTLSLAESRHAPWALGIIAFTESSFFPVPPDAILIPMSLARPKRAWVYALSALWVQSRGRSPWLCDRRVSYETIGRWRIDLYSYDERVDQFRALYAQWAGQSFSLSNRSWPPPDCGLGHAWGNGFLKPGSHTRSRIMKFTSDRHSGRAVKAVPTF